MIRNRRWTLRRRPDGPVSTDNFELLETEFPHPELADGEVLVRNHLFAVAPTIRNWLGGQGKSYRGSVAPGGTIPGMAGCEVLASRNAAYPVGTRIIAMSRWEDFSVLAPDAAAVPVFGMRGDMTFEMALGPLSPNSLTAYFGLLAVGRPLAGETVLVSGAAGSVGSVVCQIAHILDCRVIAVAGGAEKCDWLARVCCADQTIDYRAENVAARLAELCPGGVDVVFDNVGGDFLQAAVDNIAAHGRIVLCGQISAYDGPTGAAGPRDMMKLVYGRVRMEGFVVGDFIDEVDEARAVLAAWWRNRKLHVRIDRREGIECLPGALVDLFSGANEGTLLVAS